MYEQIYFLTQMFFKSLRGNLMFEFLYSCYNGKRGPKRRLCLEKVVALNIFRFHYKVSDLKSYHKLLSDVMIDKIPELPNYENFLKATNKSSVFIYAFMNFLLTEFSYGTVFADAGYLQKNEVYERMADRGLKFESATRKNMNRLMSGFECFHIKHRSIIESDWGILKGNYQLEYHKARNIHGMFRHFFTAFQST